MPENFSEKHNNVSFNNAVTFALAARAGLLYPLVGSSNNYSGDEKSRILNEFDELAMSDQETRNGDTNLTDIDSLVRFILAEPAADVATLLDKNDQKVTQVELGSPIAARIAQAAQRYHDRKWLEGYYGTAWGGKTGDTAIPFKAANVLPAGGSGITMNKLIETRELLGLGNIDFDEEMPIMLITPRQETDLLKIEEYKNSDYNDGHVLVRGEIKPFMGFRFIRFNPDSKTKSNVHAYGQARYLTKAQGSNVRRLPVFVPSGLHRGIWTEFWGDIGPRRDKKVNTQMYGEARSAVTRTDEDKCFLVECQEAVPAA